MSKTFVIIKPDTVKRGLIGRIISRFEDANFQITKMEMRRKDFVWFDLMYPHLTGDVYQDMKDFMPDSFLVGVVLESAYVVERVRRMIGGTNSVLADLGTIRGDFGSYPVRYNCIHASDDATVVENEIALFFDGDTDYVPIY